MLILEKGFEFATQRSMFLLQIINRDKFWFCGTFWGLVKNQAALNPIIIRNNCLYDIWSISFCAYPPPPWFPNNNLYIFKSQWNNLNKYSWDELFAQKIYPMVMHIERRITSKSNRLPWNRNIFTKKNLLHNKSVHILCPFFPKRYMYVFIFGRAFHTNTQISYIYTKCAQSIIEIAMGSLNDPILRRWWWPMI